MNIIDFFNSKEAMKEFGSEIIRPCRKKKQEDIQEERQEERQEEIQELTVHRIERHSMTDFMGKLQDISFRGSVIIKADLCGVVIDRMNWTGVIRSIYEFMNDVDKIRKNSILNIRDGKHACEKGFVYIQSMDISFQAVSAERSIKEIFLQILAENFDFSIEILRVSNRYIFYNK